MDRIRNIDTLERVLISEDPLWQRRVFAETGVAVLPWEKGKPYWELISSCGLADLEDDSEYAWKNGKDVSTDCVISSVNDLISYIMQMVSYSTVLKDVDLGGYRKSELFWAIYYRILNQNRYPDDDPYMSGRPIFGMKQIVGPGCTSGNVEKDALWFRASMVDVDELGVIEISTQEYPSFNQVMNAFAEDLRGVWESLDMDTLTDGFKYDSELRVIIPSSYDEVINSRNMIRF